MMAVDRSGRSFMSDSLIAFQPAIDEPSNIGAVFEEVVIDQIDVERDVLHLAAWTSVKRTSTILDVLFLDQVQDFLGGAHSVSPS